jgi:hypothetical protein
VLVRRHRVGGRFLATARWRLRPRVLLLALKQRVLQQVLFELLFELDRRQLQQPNRLLELWGQGKMLGKLELEGRFHLQNRGSRRIVVGKLPIGFSNCG